MGVNGGRVKVSPSDEVSAWAPAREHAGGVQPQQRRAGRPSEVSEGRNGAAGLCGTTAKTVKRVLERRVAGQVGRRAPQARVRTTASVLQLIEQRVQRSEERRVG